MKSRGIGEPSVLAVDIGGTKIIAALITPGLEITKRVRVLTDAEGGYEASLSNLWRAIDEIMRAVGQTSIAIHSLCIAAAGAVNMTTGVVTVSPNLMGWFDVPLRDLTRTRYGLDTFVINDAKAAALAEYNAGAGRGVENMVFLTVSTGIGGAIISDGQLCLGQSGVAGEWGHMTVEASGPRCLCGQTGCLEIMACGRTIAREAQLKLKNGTESLMLAITGGIIENVTAKTVGEAAAEGDATALEVINRAAYYLGVGMANIVNIVNPGRIVVGGGVSKMGELLLAPTRRVVRERAFKLASADASIVCARFGDDAGVLGAAIYARSESNKNKRNRGMTDRP